MATRFDCSFGLAQANTTKGRNHGDVCIDKTRNGENALSQKPKTSYSENVAYELKSEHAHHKRTTKMNPESWSIKTDPKDAARRAGGRRHYNSVRQCQANVRRTKVVELLEVYGFLRGSQSAIAKELGVHRSTVCRDLQYFGLLERGYSPYEIHLKRKAERGQEIPFRPDTSPTDLRFDRISVLMRKLAAMGLSQAKIDIILNHVLA
jgi:hypothetical protein